MQAPDFNDALLARFAKLSAFVLDMDGVLTDGRMYLDANQTAMRAFNALDGQGIKLLRAYLPHLQIALITASPHQTLIEKRMNEMGIEHIITHQPDKLAGLTAVAQAFGIELKDCAYMGDDINDWHAIGAAGMGIVPINGHYHVKTQANYITVNPAGEGAVREITDLFLKANGQLDRLYAAIMQS